MGAEVSDAMSGALRTFLTAVIKDAVTFCEHSRRRTVFARDVVMALKRAGNSSRHTILYGFDDGDSGAGRTSRPRRRNKKPTVATAPADIGPILGADPDDHDAGAVPTTAAPPDAATEDEKNSIVAPP